ncbi:MAG: GEVED domain-containing protein, partial [Bacteroidota bacterium]
PCAGTPNPGNTISSTSLVCSSSSVFTLSLQNQTPGGGVTYNWQSAPSASGPWTNLAPGQCNTLTVSGQSVNTFYRAEVICGPSGSTGVSNPVFVPVNIWGQAGCGTFCTSPVYSLGAQNCGLYNIFIGNVTVGGINNTTGCNPIAPYYEFFPQVGTIQATQPTPISVTAPNLANQIYAQYYKVYIDLNNNGSFEDVGELVYNSGQVGGLAVVPVGTITLPLNASTGFKRMRVRATNNDINSCTADGLGGEVEDYIVNILPPPQCSGAPTPGNTVASSATACLGTPINFSLSGFDPLSAGYSYVWQTAPSANGPWTSQITPSFCSYTFRLTDSFGDGWNNALMEVRQGATVVATLGSTFTTGTQLDVPLSLNPNTPYSLVYTAGGSWPSEVGIQIIDQSGATIYTLTAGAGIVGNTLHSWTTGACTMPPLPTFSATQTAASLWYRALVSCAGSGLTTAAVPVEVISPAVTSVTDVTRCGAGTVQLNATAQSGYNVGWLTSPTGGNILGTGNTITSPLIAQNTTYYAGVIGGFGGYSIQAHPLVGGNGCGAGNMFNVTPNKQIEITSFVANLPTVGSQNVKVWYRTGTYAGSEANQAAWTLVADLTVNGLGGNQPSLVTLPTPLQLAGGQTYGFYFQANVSYTNIGGAVTAQTTNNDMVIDFGAGLCTAFTSPIALRKWNGTINYTAACISSPTPLQVTVTPSTPINATAASPVVCIGNQAQLSVTSSNPNYNYSWYNTSGFSATGATAAAPITASGNYFVYALDPNDNCGAIDTVAVTATPNNVVASVTAPSAVCFGKDAQLTASATEGTYCVPLNSTGCTFPDIITGVNFGGIVNTSACNNPAAGQGGFSYFPTPNPSYAVGTPYSITVTTGGDLEGIGVWIDYNQNSTFDASELVLSGYLGTNPATYSGTVNIPATAFNGSTRMRVRCAYNTNAGTVGPCTAVTYGETEDYLITITGGVSVNSGFSYLWTPGTFLNSTTASNPVAQSMIATTTYSVTATSGVSGCKKTESKTINVNPLPVPSLTPNSPAVCEGNTIELSALNGTSYQFTYPSGSTVTLPGTIFGVLVTPTTSATFGVHDGNYSVQVTDANGCSQTETVYIGVNQLPSVSLVSSTPASCPDSYDGSFEVQSLTGTPPFTFTEIAASGGSMVSFDGIFPGLGIGTYTVIVQDGAQPVNCFSAFTLDAVVDTIPNTPPVLSGTPGNVTTANSPGLCGAIVNYTAPTASDACPTGLGAVIQTSGLPSGSLFPIGTTVNSFSVTDAEGVGTTSSFTVNVTDSQSPVIANVPASFSSCNPVTWTPPTVTDNCPGVVTTASHLPGTNFPAGTTTVTYTSTDVYGNVSTSSFNVTRLEASADPVSVTSNRDFNNICVGENIVLSVNGGSLGDAASWKWYRSACGGATNLVGTGTSITVAPTTTTTYFVRAEGTCNITACASLTVVVSTTGPGSAPTFSAVPANAAPGVTSQVCVNPVPGAIAYQWFTQVGHQSAILFNGQVGPVQTNSNCVNVSFVQPQQNYFIRVFALNACGRTNQANSTTRGTVAAPTSLTGAITACPGDSKTYNITVAASQSPVTYNWVLTPVPAGSATITVAANQLSAVV